jgi:hypothetical protein
MKNMIVLDGRRSINDLTERVHNELVKKKLV